MNCPTTNRITYKLNLDAILVHPAECHVAGTPNPSSASSSSLGKAPTSMIEISPLSQISVAQSLVHNNAKPFQPT